MLKNWETVNLEFCGRLLYSTLSTWETWTGLKDTTFAVTKNTSFSLSKWSRNVVRIHEVVLYKNWWKNMAFVYHWALSHDSVQSGIFNTTLTSIHQLMRLGMGKREEISFFSHASRPRLSLVVHLSICLLQISLLDPIQFILPSWCTSLHDEPLLNILIYHLHVLHDIICRPIFQNNNCYLNLYIIVSHLNNVK